MLQVKIDRPTVESIVKELAKINHMDNDEFVTNCLALHLGIPAAQASFSGPEIPGSTQPMYADL
jgi:hypothetical protein